MFLEVEQSVAEEPSGKMPPLLGVWERGRCMGLGFWHKEYSMVCFLGTARSSARLDIEARDVLPWSSFAYSWSSRYEISCVPFVLSVLGEMLLGQNMARSLLTGLGWSLLLPSQLGCFKLVNVMLSFCHEGASWAAAFSRSLDLVNSSQCRGIPRQGCCQPPPLACLEFLIT